MSRDKLSDEKERILYMLRGSAQCAATMNVSIVAIDQLEMAGYIMPHRRYNLADMRKTMWVLTVKGREYVTAHPPKIINVWQK